MGSLVVVVVDLGVAAGEDDGAARVAEDAAPREAISGATGGKWPCGWWAYRGWFSCASLGGRGLGGSEVRVEVGGCGDSMMWVCSKSIDMIEVLRRLIEG